MVAALQTLSARGLAFVTEKRYILLRCRGVAPVQLWPRLLLVTYNSCNMELEDFFNECVTMVADRVTNEILKRLATVEEEDNKSEYMTFKQIQNEFFISRQTVDRRVKNRELPKIKDKGRVLFLRKDVNALFKTCSYGKVNARKYHKINNAV